MGKVSSIRWITKDEDLNLEEIVERFQEYHEPIAHHFSSGKGISLQNSDSRMAELVIKKFTSMYTPILCVHDSFVVQNQYEDLLWAVMEEAWTTISNEMTDGLVRSFTKIKNAKPVKEREETRGDQIDPDKVTEKADPEYKRRWTAHQERVWEEVYYREED